MIHIIGGGLAGSEAAWQAAAAAACRSRMHEMRPVRPTAVHKTDGLAELVCSNSFRGDKLDNAVGLLKEEMRRLGSLVMRAADAARVPAGAALAVDRVVFSQRVTEAHRRAPADHHRARGGAGASRRGSGWSPVIVATGPLTSDALSADIRAFVGGDHLYFYDAISPIVLAETIDMAKVFRASRWDRSLRGAVRCAQVPCRCRRCRRVRAVLGRCCGVDDGEGDYLNCPLTKDEYDAFYRGARHAPNRRRCTTSTRRNSSRAVCRSR